MLYKRNFSVYSFWKAFLFVSLCFSPAPILLLFNASGVFGSTLAAPVNPVLFSKLFVWAHVLIIVSLICGILALILAPRKIPSLQHHFHLLTKREKAEFIKKYSVPPDKVTEKTYWGYILVMILSTFMAPVVFWAYKFLFPRLYSETVAAFLAFILVGGPFYYCALKIMQKSAASMEPLLSWINSRLPETSIKQEAPSLNYTGVGLNTSQSLQGLFMGHAFALKYTTSSAKVGRQTRSQGAAHITFRLKDRLPLAAPVIITEKNEGWRKIEEQTLDECFQKRFKLEGIDASFLPQTFKSLCLENQRSLFLRLAGNELVFEGANMLVYPAYTVYGQILFLDFMNSLAMALAEMH